MQKYVLQLIIILGLWGGLASTPASGCECPTDTDLGQLETEANKFLKQSTELLIQAEEVNNIQRRIMSYGIASDTALDYAVLFVRYGNRTGVDPLLLYAIASHESEFNRQAHNPYDPSWGLMQVMPLYWGTAFARQCGTVATPESLMEPEVAICYGAHIVAFYQSRFPTDSRAALAAYNNGHGTYNGYALRILQLADMSSS